MLSRLLRSTSCLCALIATGAAAAPVGGTVSGGAATIGGSAGHTVVDQHSARAVIDWRQFDIGTQESVTFRQPSASSLILNRINDTKPSRIDGALSANGRVILVNPNGLVFGGTARVDVGGLTASTADIDTQSFMNGGTVFDKPGNPGARIVNEGRITARDAGLVGLVAPQVENRGTIEARLGRVQLSSGDIMTLDMAGDGLIQVAVTAETLASQRITNDGAIMADGGTVILSTAAARRTVDSLIEHRGVIRADTVDNRTGTVILQASGSNGTGKTGDSTVLVSGAISADGTGAGTGARGGDIAVLGDRVGLMAGASVTANGEGGGGHIRVGGAYQGQGATQRAKQAHVDAAARIAANATVAGNGGEVIVWSDEATRFHGRIEATGGASAGDGGLVEVSGKAWLDFNGRVSTAAANGRSGTLLLDPTNITISTGTNAAGWNGTAFSGAGASSILNVGVLQDQLDDTNVVVTTASMGASPGNITVSNAVTWSAGHSLTLLADNDITLNAALTYTGSDDTFLLLRANRNIIGNANGDIAATGSGALDVTFHADADNLNYGAIRLNAGMSVDSNGGDIVLGGGPDPRLHAARGDSSVGQNNGIRLSGVELHAHGGDIMVRGHSAGAAGMYINNATILTTSGFGSILLDGESDVGSTTASQGIYFGRDSGTVNPRLEVEHGNIEVSGRGGSNALSSDARGLILFYAEMEATGDGSIFIDGTSGAGGGGGADLMYSSFITTTGTIDIYGYAGMKNSNLNRGIRVVGSRLESDSGDILLEGASHATGGVENPGIYVYGQSTLQTGGDGEIRLTGTGAAHGGDRSAGIIIGASAGDTAIHLTTENGDIVLDGTGRGTGTNHHGIWLHENGSNVRATGSGSVILQGRADPGGGNVGISGSSANTVGLGTATGDITFIADTIQWATPTITRGDIAFRPFTAGRGVSLGTAVTNTLNLSTTLLSTLTWGGTLWLGGYGADPLAADYRNQAGAMTIGMDHALNGNVTMMSRADITVDGGRLRKTGGPSAANWRMQADGSVIFQNNARVAATAGSVNLGLYADYDHAGGGLIRLGGGTSIATGGGNATFHSPVALSGNSVVNTGTGTAAFAHAVNGTAAYADGIQIQARTLTLGGPWGLGTSLGAVSLTSGQTLDLPAFRGRSLLARTTGTGADIVLHGALALHGSGTTLELAAEDDIINLHGANVFTLTGGGRFLTWSDSPMEDVGEAFFGGVKRYNRAYGSAVPESGNVRNYTIAPVLSATIHDAGRVYGHDNPAFSHTPLTGFIDGDSEATAGISASYHSASPDSPAGTYAITGAFLSAMGYQFALSPGTLTVESTTSHATRTMPLHLARIMALPIIGTNVMTPVTNGKVTVPQPIQFLSSPQDGSFYATSLDFPYQFSPQAIRFDILDTASGRL